MLPSAMASPFDDLSAAGAKPCPEKIEKKISASRARVFISRARFAFTRMRPRAVARRSAAAKSFVSKIRRVACAAESPPTARAATEEVRR